MAKVQATKAAIIRMNDVGYNLLSRDEKRLVDPIETYLQAFEKAKKRLDIIGLGNMHLLTDEELDTLAPLLTSTTDDEFFTKLRVAIGLVDFPEFRLLMDPLR